MAQTQTLSRQTDDTPEILALDVADPLVMRAAQHLIVRHRQGQRFDIEALDIPHEALATIGAQLEDAGISHALSAPLVDALRRYIMANGGSFARAANAKPVRINLVVADRMPKARFDQAVTELACLGAREVKVEGATRVNVRATPSGTATSSNAADVDAMFSNVRGLYLWIRFEAPTKAELDGMMSAVEAALAGAAQSMGGAMGAADLKKLLETLQQDGVLTPAIEAVINTLIKIQDGLGRDGKTALPAAAMDALVQELGALIDKAQAQGMMPPALMQAVMTSLADAAPDHPAIAAMVVENGFANLIADNDNIALDQRLETLMEKIEALAAADGIDPALAAQLTEMLEKAKANLAQEEISAAAVLQTLGDTLTDIAARGDIPAALFDGIGAVLPEIAALKETAQRDAATIDAPAVDPAQGEALLAVLEDIAAKIEKGEVDIKDVPPELQALIEKMGGVETLMQVEGREARAAALADAVTGQGDPQLSETVDAAVLAMADPQAMASLPPELQQTVQTFIADNPAIVGAAVTHTVIRDIGAMLDAADPASPEASELKQALDIIKAEGIAALIAQEPKGLLPPAVLPVVQAFVADHPAAVSVVLAASPLVVSSTAPTADMPAADGQKEIAHQTPDPSIVTPTIVAAARVYSAVIPPATGNAAPSSTAVEATATRSTSTTADASSPTTPSTPTTGTGGAVNAHDGIAPAKADVTVPAHPVEIATGLQTLAANVITPGQAQPPTADKAAQVLLEQAAKTLAGVPPGQPPSADIVKSALQNLVDAKDKATDPAVRQKIEANIQALEKTKTADGKPETRPEPTPKPGCHPICKCHDTHAKAEAAKEHGKDSLVVAVTKEGIVLKDGTTRTFAEIEKSRVENEAAQDRVLRATSETPPAFSGGGNDGSGFDAKDLAKELAKGFKCRCPADHSAQAPGKAFGDAAQPTNFETDTVNVGESRIAAVDEVRNSNATAALAASFGIK